MGAARPGAARAGHDLEGVAAGPPLHFPEALVPQAPSSVATDLSARRACSTQPPYEKRSVAVSSNLHPSGFDEIMPKTLAGATVDRLLHHAHLCATTGDSIRLAQATTGKGVTPLT